MKNNCERVLEIVDSLLGPNGCPWDKEQTLLSMRRDLLEEVCELVDAINSGDKEHIKEEMGDLLFNALFLARLAEKEQVCSLEGVIEEVSDKLIRRHPHVFDETKEITTEELLEQWDQIKQNEKGKNTRVAFEGIPVSLPALARAQKMSKRMKKQGISVPPGVLEKASPTGRALWDIIQKAQAEGVEAEQELRMILTHISDIGE